MSFFMFAIISGLSIGIPTLIALYSYKQMKGRYYPLCIILIVGLTNEIVSLTMIKLVGTNMLTINIYTGIEFILLSWLFYNLKRESEIHILIALLIGLPIWIADNTILHQITKTNTLFKLFACMAVIWYCVYKLSELTLNSVADQFRWIDLLLCFSLLVYFTFKGFILVLHTFSAVSNSIYFIHLSMILCTLNIIVNIFLSLVILCIRKSLSTIPY
jgi:hypothetical protein